MITYKLSDQFEVSSRFWPNVFQTVHLHTFWEILFLCKGSLINSLDGKEKEMHTYDIALIKPENVHRLKPVLFEECEYYNITIKDEYLQQACRCIYDGLYEELHASNDLYATISPNQHNKLLNLLKNANNSFSKEKADKIHKVAFSFLLPEFILLKDSQSHSAVSQALEIMSHPKNMNLTIKEISRQIGYTPEHLTRLFQKANIGTPHHVFISLKMKHAAILLQETEMSIVDISYAVGIFSLPYFYQTFKKYHGKTPFAMRNHKK
jgi:YesN/AraC family two-component response regulator